MAEVPGLVVGIVPLLIQITRGIDKLNNIKDRADVSWAGV